MQVNKSLRIYTIHLVNSQVMFSKVKGKCAYFFVSFTASVITYVCIHEERNPQVEVTETLTENSEMCLRKCLLF